MRKTIIILALHEHPGCKCEILPRQFAGCLLCSLPCYYVLETRANTRRINVGEPRY